MANGLLGGAFFMIFWVLIMGAVLVSYIFLLIAFWKGVKAHESIAESLQQIAKKN